MLKPILKKIYRLIVKVAHKVSDFDNVFEQGKTLAEERELILSENSSLKGSIEKYEKEKSFGWPNGHYYSPVHSLEDLDCYEDVVKRSKENFEEAIPGFSERKMLKNFRTIEKYFKEYDYPEEDDSKSRFYIKNGSYPITDSLTLFAMIRHYKPKRIIEIGSGLTSALMMDVNERFFNNEIDLKFIEPYTETLLSRMNKKDKDRYKVISKKVQEVPLKEFAGLESGDFLFIDSTHVSKFNSDVNYELFNIIPSINSGVIIHFHDMFDGFEYPIGWLRNGWAWNEDYLLRAYLMANNNYEVLLMNDYLVGRHSDLLLKSYPRFKNDCGGSLWIKKIK